MVANVEIPTATALSGGKTYHYIYAAECIRWHDPDTIPTGYHTTTAHTRHHHHHAREKKRKRQAVEGQAVRRWIPHAVDRTRTHDPMRVPGSFSPIYIKSLTNAHPRKRVSRTLPQKTPTPNKTVVIGRKYTPKRGFLYYVNIEFAMVTEDKA